MVDSKPSGVVPGSIYFTFVLMVDVSGLGVGAGLIQDQQDVEHPIAYFSRKFNKSLQNYCTSEKENLALILPFQH